MFAVAVGVVGTGVVLPMRIFERGFVVVGVSRLRMKVALV